MAKVDKLKASLGANVGESMGQGRGGAAVASAPKPSTVPARMVGVKKATDVAVIPIEKIVADSDQPRLVFEQESLDRLAESLKERGQLQPIRVRWDVTAGADGAYVVVAGERRWRAAGMAGMKTLTCVVVEAPYAPGDKLIEQLIENCLREDLKPIEQAKAFKELMAGRRWGVRELARQLSIDHSGVTRAVALLDLAPEVQAKVEEGVIPPVTAYEISRAEPTEQAALAVRVEKEGLTRADVRKVVNKVVDDTPLAASASTPDPEPGRGVPVVDGTPLAADVKANGKPASGSVGKPTLSAVGKTREWNTPEGVHVTLLLPAESHDDNAVLDALRWVGSTLNTSRKGRVGKGDVKASAPKGGAKAGAAPRGGKKGGEKKARATA